MPLRASRRRSWAVSNKRLLVIDDAADFGAFVRRVAVKFDFEVEVTTDPREFKEIYKRFDPTIIVLDIVMPDTDGIELVRWLVTARCTARIIIVSGFNPSYARMADTIGSVAGLTSITRLSKPVRVADLRRAFG
jgi:DNA-binding response OmpR family regulator